MKRPCLKCEYCGSSNLDVEIWGNSINYSLMLIVCNCGKSTPIAKLHNDKLMLHKNIDIEPINS